MFAAEKGTVITLYDNSNGSTSDDYATIEILEDMHLHRSCQGRHSLEQVDWCAHIHLTTFEQDVTSDKYKVTFRRGNGSLDGRVSNVKVSFPHRM